MAFIIKKKLCKETKEQKSTIKNQFQGFLVLSLKAIKYNALCFENNHYIYTVFFFGVSCLLSKPKIRFRAKNYDFKSLDYTAIKYYCVSQLCFRVSVVV